MKLKTHHTTIPATPGWYRCSPICEGDEVVDIYEMPVIAWVITIKELDGSECLIHTQSVVAGEVPSTRGRDYLRGPGGRYIDPGCGDHLVRDELMACMQQRLASGGEDSE